jgi:DNA-binding CsgD family transcriptional regulator
MSLRAVELVPAPLGTAAVAQFSLAGSDYLVVTLEVGAGRAEPVLGTFTASGKRYAILAKAKAEPGADLIELLTVRELEIACLVASGCQCKEIARRLRISHHTVRVHLARIYAKLGLHKQTELAARIAARFG